MFTQRSKILSNFHANTKYAHNPGIIGVKLHKKGQSGPKKCPNKCSFRSPNQSDTKSVMPVLTVSVAPMWLPTSLVL